jgi:hypothetical protein
MVEVGDGTALLTYLLLSPAKATTRVNHAWRSLHADPHKV